jgi:hypothetical protein
MPVELGILISGLEDVLNRSSLVTPLEGTEISSITPGIILSTYDRLRQENNLNPMDPRSEYVIGILSQTAGKVAEPERIHNALNLRSEMHLALMAGVDPDGYRYEWLLKQSQTVLDLLNIIADDFNKEHPSDMCTVLDALDLLEMISSSMRKRLRKAEQSGILVTSDDVE